MNLSMMSCMLGTKAAPEEVIRTAQYAGLTAVDWITCHGKTAKEIRKLSDDAGIKIVAHTDFMSKFEAGESDGSDEYRRTFDNAAEMGAPVVMIPPFGHKNKTLEESRKLWLDFYARAMQEAKKYPFALTIESTGMGNSPLVTGEETLMVLKAAPGMKVTFDYGNVATACDPLQAYKMVEEYVVHFHLKDWLIYDHQVPGSWQTRDGRFHANVMIGRGVMDVKGFWAQVSPEVKKRCYVNLETIDFTNVLSKAESTKIVADELRTWQ